MPKVSKRSRSRKVVRDVQGLIRAIQRSSFEELADSIALRWKTSFDPVIHHELAQLSEASGKPLAIVKRERIMAAFWENMTPDPKAAIKTAEAALRAETSKGSPAAGVGEWSQPSDETNDWGYTEREVRVAAEWGYSLRELYRAPLDWMLADSAVRELSPKGMGLDDLTRTERAFVMTKLLFVNLTNEELDAELGMRPGYSRQMLHRIKRRLAA